MADAKLGFNVCIIKLADEGVRPCLASVDSDVHVILSVPLSPLLHRKTGNTYEYTIEEGEDGFKSKIPCIDVLRCFAHKTRRQQGLPDLPWNT